MGSVPESRLFEPLQIGPMKLSTRIVMAPLTRFRAHDSHEHNSQLAAEYYGHRAEATPGTLLLSEATPISPRASGYSNVPGIWNQAQIDSWKPIVERVHKAGSYIYCQLWALGRTAQAEIKKAEGTGDVHAPSPIALQKGGPVPREVTEDEIQAYIAEYAQAAKNAIAAGFDGVEIHGANGYLADQFLQDVSNQRTDKWGGSIENRSRFTVEITKAIVEAIGPERTGIRLSPFSEFQAMRMKDPYPQFVHVIKELRRLDIAFIHLVEPRVSGYDEVDAGSATLKPFLEAWGHDKPLLVAGGFKPENAREAVDEEYPDYDVAVVFGRFFISNPDLVFRIQRGIELTPYDRNTFYIPKSSEGYLGYAFSDQWKKEHSVRDQGTDLPVQP